MSSGDTKKNTKRSDRVGRLTSIAACAVAAFSILVPTAEAQRPQPPTYPTKEVSIPAGSQLGMIVATHRHGVRTPMLTGNTSLCTDMGCGSLNYEGKVMLAKLGQYFADCYGVGGFGADVEGASAGTPINNGNGVIPTNTANPSIPNPNNIQITRYDARSTRVIASSRDRAIQSGVGVVNGLYTALNSRNGCGGSSDTSTNAQCNTPADFVYPLINNDFGDKLLYPTDNNPAYLAFSQAYNSSMYPFMGNQTLQIFNGSDLLTMAMELSIGNGECDDNSTGTKPFPPQQGSSVFDAYVCGLDLQDDMRYLYATFGSDWLQTNAPITYQNMDKLDYLLNMFSYYFIYGFDAVVINKDEGKVGNETVVFPESNSSVSHLGGYLGYPLAASMIADMKTLQPTTGDGSTKTLLNPLEAQNAGILRFKGYSAHDMTVVELTIAMGNFTTKSIDAPFAVALFFEVWVTNPSASSNNANEDVGTRHIRAYYGYPEQAAKTNHTYTFWPYALVCTDSEGATYQSTNGCSLNDYERFIETRGPHSPAGICYISEATRQLLNCGPDRVLSPSDASINMTQYPFPTTEQYNTQLCFNYRQLCPEWACVSNSQDAYNLINSNSPNVPMGLNLATNNCVKRFTEIDGALLKSTEDKVNAQKTIVQGMIGAMVLVMVGFSSIMLLLQVLSQHVKARHSTIHDVDVVEDVYGATADKNANASVVSSNTVEAKSFLAGESRY